MRNSLENVLKEMDYDQILVWALSMPFLEIMQDAIKKRPANSKIIRPLLAAAQDICHSAVLNFPVKSTKGNCHLFQIIKLGLCYC